MKKPTRKIYQSFEGEDKKIWDKYYAALIQILDEVNWLNAVSYGCISYDNPVTV